MIDRTMLHHLFTWLEERGVVLARDDSDPPRTLEPFEVQAFIEGYLRLVDAPLGSEHDGDFIVEGRDAGGKRDYLQNKPIHAGTMLELFVAGRWLPARYESARYESRDGLIYLGDMVLPLIRQSMRFRWIEQRW